MQYFGQAHTQFRTTTRHFDIQLLQKDSTFERVIFQI